MKKQVNIQGITTTGAHADGECSRLVNLRKKNGVLRPVSARKKIRTLTALYSYLFQHNLPQTGENLIGIRNGNIYLIGENTETLLTSTTAPTTITQIGNMLNVVDANGIRQLFWVDSEYKIIDTDFGGLQTDTLLKPLKIELKVENEGIIDFEGNYMSNFKTISSESILYSDYSNYNSAENLELRKNTFKGLTEKLISLSRKEGSPVWFTLACTAIELYDGNYILHSSPVLLGQANDKHTRYTALNINSNICDYLQNKAIFKSSGTPLTTGTETLDRQESAMTGGKAIKANTSISQTWFPSVFGESHYGIVSLNNRDIKVQSNIYKNKLKFKLNANINTDYRNLIKSVSVFMTKEICPYDTETVESLKETYPSSTPGSTESSENYYFKNKTNTEILKELSESHQFYKVHEITYEELQTINPGTWIDIDLTDKLGDNLVNQESLPVDNFTHHNYKPNAQIVYNSKLHIMDYKQQLFRPWPVNYFYQTYGKGQFEGTEQEETTNAQGWIEYMSVKLKTETGMSEVVRITPELQGEYLKLFNLSPFLSYPDTRATELTIYRSYYNVAESRYFKQNRTFPLKASESQNFAYYIDSELKPINFAAGTFTDEPAGIKPESTRELIYRNSMKVSAVSNPFYFPAESTYTIGTGTILNAATNALRMSEGQFGQYDLYIITTEGIYSLDTGVEISYNRISPASLELPVSGIICPTPFGIVYAGKRGIYLIAGNEVKLLTAQVEENAIQTSIDNNALSFTSYLENLKTILYDYNQQELIFIGSEVYVYVLNIQDNMIYLSDEQIDFEVKNTNPQLIVAKTEEGPIRIGYPTINYTYLKDYSKSETNMVAVEITTRPIYFGVDELKRIQRSILRGRFIYTRTGGVNDTFISWYGSNDGINYTKLSGLHIDAAHQDLSFKDFDSRLLAKSNFRNYALKFRATISDTSQIEYIDFEVEDQYENEKMR